MINERVVNWLKEQEQKGYTEEQLKQLLKTQGFLEPDINDSIAKLNEKPDLNFHQGLLQKGQLFTYLFYAFFGTFGLSIIITILLVLLKFDLILLILLPFILIIPTYRFIKKKNYYKLLLMFFFYSPISVSWIFLFPFIQVFVPMFSITAYISLSVYTLISGLIMSFMLNKVVERNGKLLFLGVINSLSFSISFVVLKMITMVLLHVNKRMGMLTTMPDTNGMAGASLVGLLSMINIPTINSTTAFILGMVFYNLFFIIFYCKRKNSNKASLLFYLIPIILYFVLYYAVIYVVNIILGGVSGVIL